MFLVLVTSLFIFRDGNSRHPAHILTNTENVLKIPLTENIFLTALHKIYHYLHLSADEFGGWRCGCVQNNLANVMSPILHLFSFFLLCYSKRWILLCIEWFSTNANRLVLAVLNCLFAFFRLFIFAHDFLAVDHEITIFAVSPLHFILVIGRINLVYLQMYLYHVITLNMERNEMCRCHQVT